VQSSEKIYPREPLPIPVTQPSRAAIEFRNVSLYFGDHPALLDVSFSVATGETLLLLGPTASGKSVLLKSALGLLKPDSGQVLVDGVDLTPLREDDIVPLRRKMGIVFQEGALFDSLSVLENVAYRLLEERVDETAIEQRVREVLRFVEMESAIDKMPAELSGGMRRRVSIARAIASEPSIMLYDSPTAGLDPVTAQTINLLILKLRDVQKVSSIVVTHRLQDAFLLANFAYSPQTANVVPLDAHRTRGADALTRFVILREGSVYFQGTEQDFVGSSDPYLRKYII
jgi:phospholipid/cholesterol/gamma-HCH transport system ATP-binding protein